MISNRSAHLEPDVDESRAARIESARLAALHDLDLLDRGREARFDRITRIAASLFGVADAQLTLVDDDRTQIKSSVGMTGDVARGDSFCTHTVEHSDVFVVTDAAADPRFEDNPYVSGDPHLRFYAGCPITTPTGDRIGALCLVDDRPRSFSDADAAALATFARWAEQEIVAGAELDRAAEVQAGLLPKRPPSVDGWDVAGTCVPASYVGGDLFDWYATRCGTALSVADVMGKGMSAAIVMATIKAVLRAGTRGGDLVGAILLAADSLDDDFGHLDGFVTAFHALLAPGSGRVDFVDAGHGLAFVVRDGATVRLGGPGLPIGILHDSEWHEQHVDLQVGDVLVIASDGLLDIHGTPDRLATACTEAVDRHDTAASISDQLAAPARTRTSTDDVTVVVARHTA